MSERKRFYRVAFYVNGELAGTMLIPERSVEMAISRCAQTVGKGFAVHSVEPIFMSDAEEHGFLHFIIAGNPVLKDDIVNIEKRLRGV